MHEQAILVSGPSTLGAARALVSIDDIEKHYSTTVSANAGIAYCCANPKCGVPVIAVITKLAKKARKNSPSSYFRAKRSKPHVKGCTRAPVQPVNTLLPPSLTVTPASPNRTNVPTVWLDPLVHAGSVAGGGGNSATGLTSNGSGGTRSTSGTGTSQGRSQMVETFAKTWLTTNTATQRGFSLIAPWNPTGTYYSAFHPIKFNPTVDVSTSGQRIYVGNLKSIVIGASGCVITLLDKNHDGKVLEIFVDPATFLFGTAGSALHFKLNSLAGTPNFTQIFALGTFAEGNAGALSLSIAHPHYIFIQ